MRLLYYSADSSGGLADYAHEQCNALSQLGIEVTLLCAPDYPAKRGEKYRIAPNLNAGNNPNKASSTSSNKFIRAAQYANMVLSNFRRLAEFVEVQDFQTVIIGSYTEFMAPVWSGRLRKLARKGVVFGAIVHDPVRDFVLGPLWWHRWSIACSYSFLQEAFVHEFIELDTIFPVQQLRMTVIPHGPYQFPKATKSREEIRINLSLPADAKVMLSFGHIRDNKNLELIIQAMSYRPSVYLIIAGKEISSSQRPSNYYQEIAKTLGVDDRCRWLVRFIPETEVANLFNVSDLVLLTYRESFRSASGVLNAAIHFRKPCLASAGASSLKTVVNTYNLGIWIEPDSMEAICGGIHQWLTKEINPQWSRYLENNSWELNAKIIINALYNIPSQPF